MFDPVQETQTTILNRFQSFKIWTFSLVAGIAACAPNVSWADGTPQPIAGPVPKAPPTAPPIEIREGKLPPAPPVSYPKDGPTLYSIGQPTAEEQLYLEYINRSRANPSAEGARLAATTDPDVLAAYSYFTVDLAFMQAQFNTNPAVAPLAMNAKLVDAARWHSGDMYTNQYQGHDQTNGTTVMNPGARMTAQGYAWTTYGENVYSYADSVWHGHAGFNVDWGYGPGGMQSPPGHRNSIHNGNFREVGIGVVNGVNGSVGPQLVTQDFASRNNQPIITGVAYYDFNGNQFYDVGEGIGGVTVNVPGSTNYAITANSGGYAVPVSSNGNYQMNFTATGLSTQRIGTVTSGRNVKVDFVPAYLPPVVSGPNPAAINQANNYTFTAVGGATSYQWEQTRMVPYTTVEGAEGGTGNVTLQTSAGYNVYVTGIAASGSYSFHLAQPTPPTDQYLTLNAVLLARADSQLTFKKRLGYADSGQVLRAQVSANGSGSWQDLWTQTGSGGAGESGFSPVTIPLAAFAGQNLQFRFVYDFIGGYYFPQTTSGVGAYLDDITVLNVEQASSPISAVIPAGTNFVFSPSQTGDYVLHVRPQNSGTDWPWGPSLRVTAAAAPPTVTALAPVVSGNQVQIEFTVANPATNMTFQLWKSTSVNGTYAVDNGATFQTLTPNTRFRATTTTAGQPMTFYKVRLSY